MKQLLDFLPLVIFFAVYKYYDIYAATGALMVATSLQLIISYLLYKRIEKIHLVSFAIAIVFGGLSLYFHNDAFIKWKVTILYILFASGLSISHLMGNTLIKKTFGSEIQVDDKIWANLTWYWVGLFVICGLVNIHVAYNYSLETWVNVKVFGFSGLMFLNFLVTGLYLFKHMQNKPEDNQ